MSKFYPVYINLEGQLCIVIGGGNVGERKTRLLLDCGAHVRVISPELTPYLRELTGNKKIEHKDNGYNPGDLQDAFLVICAAGNPEINRQAVEECRHKGILVNVVDEPELANFFVPAVMQRDNLSIAISTGGKSPLMSRLIREDLESIYGPEFNEFIEFLGEIREKIINEIDDPVRRQKILKNLLSRDDLQVLKQGHLDEIKERVLNVYYGSRDKS